MSKWEIVGEIIVIIILGYLGALLLWHWLFL